MTPAELERRWGALPTWTKRALLVAVDDFLGDLMSDFEDDQGLDGRRNQRFIIGASVLRLKLRHIDAGEAA